jgi:threonine dehydratase
MPSATPFPSLEAAVRPTLILPAPRLGAALGCDLTLAVETFQHTGSFKFRAAYNVARAIPNPRVIAASSGNFGQAMAYACKLLGKGCTVVMPATSAAVKIDAVRSHGARVDLLDTRQKPRATRVAELAAEDPQAYVASAFDDPLVISGNASLGRELAAALDLDDVLVPLGGGGLSAGMVLGLREVGSSARVWGAEPLLANDGARSLAAGEIVRNEFEPPTLADGARTLSLGRHNWEILRGGLAGVIEVPEAAIAEGLRRLFLDANVKAEPTGALGVGALLTSPERFRGRRVACVVSGGNVDPALYARLLAGADSA